MTRFSNNIIEWARQHDWFHASDNIGQLWVRNRHVDRDGNVHDEVIQWTRTLRELRDWAGY